jgi:hypothetical protein
MTKKTEKKPLGRPSEPVPQDKADEICEWITTGRTLREWCRLNHIHYSTVYLWMGKDKDFAQRFAHAREVGHDCIADDALEIIDTMPLMTGGDNPKYDSAHVAWLRNRAEYRLKLLAKWNPKKYGDRTTLAGDPDNPLMEPMDDTQRAAKLQAILATAQARKAKNGGGV